MQSTAVIGREILYSSPRDCSRPYFLSSSRQISVERSHSFYYGFRLNEFQNIEFERLYENSGAVTKSQFILSAIFDKPMKVVKIDKAATDYYVKLTNLQSEYRRVGVNYNQVVKAVHSGELTEKKALALLYKLEQLTVELISLNKEIIRLTKEFEQWLQG